MHEHSWWLVYREGGDRVMRCPVCGTEQSLNKFANQFTVILVEDEDDEGFDRE